MVVAVVVAAVERVRLIVNEHSNPTRLKTACLSLFYYAHIAYFGRQDNIL